MNEAIRVIAATINPDVDTERFKVINCGQLYFVVISHNFGIGEIITRLQTVEITKLPYKLDNSMNYASCAIKRNK